MKWYVIIPLILFSFSSCSRDADIPVEIIKPKQMQALIWDMARADAYSDVLHQKDTINTLSKISMNLTDNLLALHKTNRTQVENSFKFYSKHPDIFKIERKCRLCNNNHWLSSRFKGFSGTL